MLLGVSEEVREMISRLEDPTQLLHYSDITQIVEALTGENMGAYLRKVREYELLSVELVDDIAELLEGLPSFDLDVPIVEVCAGKGKLSYHLQQRDIKIIATDSYSTEMERMVIVERLDHKSAVETYNPRIVLASWMPNYKPIGADVLRHPSVEHLVHIGDGKLCGTADRYRISNNYVSEEAGRHLIDVGKQSHSTVEVFEYK